jgi:hypothetical protein
VSKRTRQPPKRALEILRHYLDNPATADSLEGIAGWRLVEDLVQRRVEETEQALRWLVANDYLERTERQATPPLYRLKPARRADGERLVGGDATWRPTGRRFEST